jgi:hypothetical protein
VKIALVEIDPKPEWRAGLDALASELAAAGHEVVRGGPADAWLVCSGGAALPSLDVETRRRTIVLGVDQDWGMGLGELLESLELAGAIVAAGLIEWKSPVSPFSGLKRLLGRFASTPFKAMQTPHYCSWVHAPGGSLAAFLSAYLGELTAFSDTYAGYLRARDRRGFESSIEAGLRSVGCELEATLWRAWCRDDAPHAGPSLPTTAADGDLWFDVCELATMARVDRGWLATAPVPRWRMRAFLDVTTIEPREVQVDPPYRALDPARLCAGTERAACTDITPGEATLYAWWFGKSLPHMLDWESARRWAQLDREWITNRLRADEGARVFVTADTIGWDPDEVACDPRRRDRMIRGDYTRDPTIGFRTFVTTQLGLLRSVSSWHIVVEPVRLASILDRDSFR